MHRFARISLDSNAKGNKGAVKGHRFDLGTGLTLAAVVIQPELELIHSQIAID